MAENITENANFIYQFFRERNWTSQSICSMLGNMQAESGLIADIDELSGGGGYGLVQWTPKSKLTSWADANGLDYKNIGTQCQRIQWELANSEQYYKTTNYPLTFKEFTESTLTPTYLAETFLHNYERPANLNQPARGVYAEEWYALLANQTQFSPYTIQAGDTLFSIANRFGVTVADLQTWNQISDPNKIVVGQILMISKPPTYTVKAGDTLSSIAALYSVTVTELQTWNHIVDTNKISVGQILNLFKS